jgi:protein YibB
MSKITIVTAFFDIGRGDWTTNVQKNGGPLPHYLHRSVDKYLDHFRRMCEIDTEIIVYTSPDLINTIKSVNEKIKVVGYDYFNIHENLRNRIDSIQKSPVFINKVNPYQVRNPEYWSKDYVGVTSLKAFYIKDAFDRNLITNEWAAWVDFGYCRDDSHIPLSKKWEYDFVENKMNYFNYRDPVNMNDVNIAVLNNLVYIIGGVFVGQRESWILLNDSMKKSLEILMDKNMVDDDQGLLLMSYFMNPDKYALHKMPLSQDIEEVRSIIRKFNKYE